MRCSERLENHLRQWVAVGPNCMRLLAKDYYGHRVGVSCAHGLAMPIDHFERCDRAFNGVFTRSGLPVIQFSRANGMSSAPKLVTSNATSERVGARHCVPP